MSILTWDATQRVAGRWPGRSVRREGVTTPMVVLLDTSTLPAGERSPAMSDLMSSAGMPTSVSHGGPAELVYTRVLLSQLGRLPVLGSAGSALRLERSERHLRSTPLEQISVAFTQRGSLVLCRGGATGVIAETDLVLLDLAQPYSALWPGPNAAISLQIGYDELCLPIDVVRRALYVLPGSPLYGLVQRHMARLSRNLDELAAGPSAAMLGTGTVELVRALISSAAGGDLRLDEAANGALSTRIACYVQQNLGDPGLCAEQIAREHDISLRQLYRLWAVHGATLAEWIMAERLAAARHDLATQCGGSAIIAVVARRRGFADPTHFARRFREAYGMSPREWRELHRMTSVREL